MEENPPRFPRKDGTHMESSSKGGPTKKNSCSCRYTTTTTTTTNVTASPATYSGGVDEGGDLIECSGKYCGSCTAGLIADCVALCCCPCALINIFAFAFVKVPWMVGRKCLKRVKRRKKEMKMKMKSNKIMLTDQTAEDDEEERDGNMRNLRVEDGILEIVGNGFNGEELGDGFEAERVWLELYKDGHLGFGRVSFTGIQ